MGRIAAVACVMFLCCRSGAAQAAPVTRAYADDHGWVHIIVAAGHEQIIKPERWQAGGGFESVQTAFDGKTVGWLADEMLTPDEGATNYAYPVALDLDIWRDGRVIRKFPTPGFPIDQWRFLKDGREVAFHVAPPHGIEYYNCFLFDVTSGKRLAHWSLDRKDYVVPDWAKPLLADDPLPGPDEIDVWLANLPRQTARPSTRPRQ